MVGTNSSALNPGTGSHRRLGFGLYRLDEGLAVKRGTEHNAP